MPATDQVSYAELGLMWPHLYSAGFHYCLNKASQDGFELNTLLDYLIL